MAGISTFFNACLRALKFLIVIKSGGTNILVGTYKHATQGLKGYLRIRTVSETGINVQLIICEWLNQGSRCTRRYVDMF